MSRPSNPYAGDRSVAETWQALADDPKAVLVDVRTTAEWTFVGVPDLGPLGKEPVLLEWQGFPGGTPRADYGQVLGAELARRGVASGDPVYFLCRSGGRSQRAAIALTAEGYSACFNVADGFEGPLDGDGHRGAVGGWKAAGLPWTQS